MSLIRTGFRKPRAVDTPFNKQVDIPETDAQRAIERVNAGSAPVAAQYLVATANSVLTAERVATDTATIAWDFATAAQGKANVVDDSITFAKMQNITTDRLLGRDTASSGDPEEISVGGGIEFTGSAGIQRSALTGDISASAGSATTTLATVNSNVGQFGSASAVSRPTVNGKGLVTAIDTVAISIASSAVTDFTEAVQDVMDGILVGSEGTGDIDWTYTDGSNTLTGAVKSDAITFAKMQNIATDRLLGRDTASSGDVEEISLGASLEFSGSSSIQRAALTGAIVASANSNATTSTINLVVCMGGSSLATGIVKGADVHFDFAATIVGWTLFGDASGAIVVDIWKDSYTNFAPTVADTITASAKPTISASGIKNQSSTLTGWTTSIAAGDVLRFNVDSVTTIVAATLILKLTKTS